MKLEIFKDIPGYEGLYQVSNLGNVKSLERIAIRQKKGNCIVKERILKPANNGHGYYHVVLFKDGKRKTMTIHIIVARAFLDHVPNGHKIEVDHKNDIRTDNRLENLQLLLIREHKTKTFKSKKTSSEYTGVSWSKIANKWVVGIKIDGKKIHLGYFTDEYQAHLTYQKALEMYNNGDLSFMEQKKYSSQYKGVSWDKQKNKWKSRIYINGKPKHLGFFTDEYEGHLTYQKALNELNK
jgi:hypothetical protein